MHCPNCGHLNNDLATRCSACGSPLPEPLEKPANAGTSQPQDTSSPDGTAKRIQVAVDAPPIEDGDESQLHGAAHTIRTRLSTMGKRVNAFCHAHERALGIGIAICVTAVIGVLWVTLTLTNMPTYTQIEDDMRTLLPTFSYAGGTFGPDLDIPLASVTITKRDRAQTPQGLEANARGGAYRVEAEATYDDGTMHVVRNVGAMYVQANDSWSIVGELDELGTSFTALAGVDEGKVLASIGTILDAADSMGGDSLVALYENGSFSIEGNDFEQEHEKDTATDDVIIRCAHEAGFYAYAGNVTARFAFESGEWRLRNAEADAHVAQRSYDPLVGTWTGTLAAHDAVGASCYGAQEQALVVTIDSVGDPSEGGGQVRGTVSGIAHYHKRLERDQNTSEGDELIDGIPFSGVISTTYDPETGSNLTIACTTPGLEKGDFDLTLSFGTEDDPSAVFARAITTHRYEELLFMLFPHQTTAQFTDTYVLSRE